MKIFAILLLAAPMFGQTITPVARMPHAYKLCTENDTIVSMPAGTVFQFGANEIPYGQTNTWLPPETSTTTYPKLPFLVTYTAWPVNPTPETKEIDVQQTSVAQTFQVKFYGQSTVTTVTVPALPAATNDCSTDNTSCTIATNSDAAHIITTAGDVALNPTETATLKAAIQALQQAKNQVVTAQAALQTVQQAIAVSHGASATGPYQISTDFDTTIEQVPPVPVTSMQ